MNLRNYYNNSGCKNTRRERQQKSSKSNGLRKAKTEEDFDDCEQKNEQINDIDKKLLSCALDIFEINKERKISVFNILSKKLETLEIRILEKKISQNNNSNQIYLNKLINLFSKENAFDKKIMQCKSGNYYFYSTCLVLIGNVVVNNIVPRIVPHIKIDKGIMYVNLRPTIEQIKKIDPEKVMKLQTEIIKEITSSIICNYCPTFVGC